MAVIIGSVSTGAGISTTMLIIGFRYLSISLNVSGRFCSGNKSNSWPAIVDPLCEGIISPKPISRSQNMSLLPDGWTVLHIRQSEMDERTLSRRGSVILSYVTGESFPEKRFLISLADREKVKLYCTANSLSISRSNRIRMHFRSSAGCSHMSCSCPFRYTSSDS